MVVSGVVSAQYAGEGRMAETCAMVNLVLCTAAVVVSTLGADSLKSIDQSPVTGFRAVNVGLDIDKYVYTTGGAWSTGFVIKAGDSNGDGADLFLYHDGAGTWWEVLTTPSMGFQYYSGIMSEGWTVTVGDLNGDGRIDLFLYHPVVGTRWQALTAPGGTFSIWNGAYMSEGWQVSATDLDGDDRQ